jgi:glycosyltransferase involved in cell wall biosynthesis
MFATIPHILRFPTDIVASINWGSPPAYYTYLARSLRRFVLVAIPLFHTTQAWSERTIYKRMLASCDAVVVNTDHEGQFVHERSPTRVEVAGVGVDPEAFYGSRGDDIRARFDLGRFPVVGFVGRQVPTKGVYKLIEAMPSVWRWNKEVRLVLAGHRPPRSDIEAVIDPLPESQKERIVQIDMFDERDKGSIFDSFDVFALPSTEESFGIAYLEAWLCRKPVIGARIGSTQCVINEGVDGLLVDPTDPHDIARAIIELLSDSNMRERMGRNGHAKTIAQYTWDKVTDKVEKLYLSWPPESGAPGFLGSPKLSIAKSLLKTFPLPPMRPESLDRMS